MMFRILALLPRANGRVFSHASTSTDFTSKDRKSTRLNSSHANISYAVFCLKKKKQQRTALTPLTPISSYPYYDIRPGERVEVIEVDIRVFVVEPPLESVRVVQVLSVQQFE